VVLQSITVAADARQVTCANVGSHLARTMLILRISRVLVALVLVVFCIGANALPAVPDTIADGLRHTSPAPLPWEVNKVLLDDVVTVTDDRIALATLTTAGLEKETGVAVA
jgi:hypothetical protein